MATRQAIVKESIPKMKVKIEIWRSITGDATTPVGATYKV
jgi:hypothetical protein